MVTQQSRKRGAAPLENMQSCGWWSGSWSRDNVVPALMYCNAWLCHNLSWLRMPPKHTCGGEADVRHIRHAIGSAVGLDVRRVLAAAEILAPVRCARNRPPEPVCSTVACSAAHTRIRRVPNAAEESLGLTETDVT